MSCRSSMHVSTHVCSTSSATLSFLACARHPSRTLSLSLSYPHHVVLFVASSRLEWSGVLDIVFHALASRACLSLLHSLYMVQYHSFACPSL